MRASSSCADTSEERTQLGHILDRCQTLRTVNELVSDFAGMAREGRGQHLNPWVAAAPANGISRLHRFATGLLADYYVVRAGLALTWRSGAVEGNVIGIETIKTQLCGLANFDLFRRRVWVVLRKQRLNSKDVAGAGSLSCGSPARAKECDAYDRREQPDPAADETRDGVALVGGKKLTLSGESLEHNGAQSAAEGVSDGADDLVETRCTTSLMGGDGVHDHARHHGEKPPSSDARDTHDDDDLPDAGPHADEHDRCEQDGDRAQQ